MPPDEELEADGVEELELEAIGLPLPVGSVMPAQPAARAAGAPMSSRSKLRRLSNSGVIPMVESDLATSRDGWLSRECQ